MIIAGGANGNVFGYNASFNKPLMNWDEASLSVHGHYPYLNLFEGNFAEHASIDYVWGENGPYNTFFRNFIYHKGYLFGFIHNQTIRVDDGNNDANIVANLANFDGRGGEHLVLNNTIEGNLDPNKLFPIISLYHKSKPQFFTSGQSWPAIGLKSGKNALLPKNEIPAQARFFTDIKTVPSGPILKTSKSKRIKVE